MWDFDEVLSLCATLPFKIVQKGCLSTCVNKVFWKSPKIYRTKIMVEVTTDPFLRQYNINLKLAPVTPINIWSWPTISIFMFVDVIKNQFLKCTLVFWTNWWCQQSSSLVKGHLWCDFQLHIMSGSRNCLEMVFRHTTPTNLLEV